jgi:hypothetical protein
MLARLAFFAPASIGDVTVTRTSTGPCGTSEFEGVLGAMAGRPSPPPPAPSQGPVVASLPHLHPCLLFAVCCVLCTVAVIQVTFVTEQGVLPSMLVHPSDYSADVSFAQLHAPWHPHVAVGRVVEGLR